MNICRGSQTVRNIYMYFFFFPWNSISKYLKATLNVKNSPFLCPTSDGVVQGAGKGASTVQLMWSFCFANRLQPIWISYNKRKPIPSSHPYTSY